MKYYNSIEEVENCIGKFVYFYYTDNGGKNGNVIFAWAMKITKIVRDKSLFRCVIHPIKCHGIFGTDLMVFEDNRKIAPRTLVPKYEGKKEEWSTAQQFARELTIIEKLLYRIYLKRQEAIEKGLIKIKPQDENKDN